MDGTARRLQTLERLLEIPSADLTTALTHATDEVSRALSSDKVDAFLHDPTRDSLVAVGTSNQPVSLLERQVGLDVLPLANGGRAVHAFRHGTFVSGAIDRDPDELKGIREVLKLKSIVAVPFDVGGHRRGVLMVASLNPEFFSAEDVRFTESVAKWVGIIAHRAELTESIAKNALEQGRRTAAEELVTVLAHDLRNHISPIGIRLNLVKRRAVREKRRTDFRDLELAQRAVARLTELISDILDVARIDQGIFSMSPDLIDVAATVQDIADGMSTPDHPIIVKVTGDSVISGDVARIRQCLENLFSNASNHSPKDGAVTVLIGRERTGERELARIEVIDEGPGIPPDLLPHLFERFVAGKHSKKGLGLGLYIARQIAKLHDGELTVDSPPEKGASFVLKLPAVES